MLGAIAGDIIGSVYEARPIKKTAFPLFHPRCRFATDICKTTEPPLVQHGSPDHLAACHHPLSPAAGLAAVPAAVSASTPEGTVF